MQLHRYCDKENGVRAVSKFYLYTTWGGRDINYSYLLGITLFKWCPNISVFYTKVKFLSYFNIMY